VIGARSFAACAAFALTFLPLAAAALPGQTVEQFRAWSKTRPALAKLKPGYLEVTYPGPFYGAEFTAGSLRGSFGAYTIGSDRIALEMVFLRGDYAYGYDITAHPDVAAALLRAVYVPGVAADFKTSAKVGSWTREGKGQTPRDLYLGKVYGYELSGTAVTVLPLSAVSTRLLKNRACAKDPNCLD
jgi:hypothetical protein